MQQRVMKRSRQRDKVFWVLRHTRSHPTAEWIFDRVREEMPHISLGTVYRNLNILRELGKIRELDFGEGLRRYDAFTDEHYHFICDQCGTVKDLEIELQKELNERLSSHVKGNIRAHRLDCFGICQACLEKGN